MPGEIQALVGEKLPEIAAQDRLEHIKTVGIRVDGRPGRFRHMGCASNGVMPHQEPLIVPRPLWQRTYAGQQPVRSGAWVDKAEMSSSAQALMQLGLDLSVDTPAKALTIAQRQLMMPSRAFSLQPKVEPSIAQCQSPRRDVRFDLLNDFLDVARRCCPHRPDEAFLLVDT